jgi:hypothetical protein
MRTRINFAARHFQPNRKFCGGKSKAFAIASYVPQGDTPQNPAEIGWRLA